MAIKIPPLESTAHRCIDHASSQRLWGSSSAITQWEAIRDGLGKANAALSQWREASEERDDCDQHRHLVARALGEVLVALALECHLQAGTLSGCFRAVDNPFPASDRWQSALIYLGNLRTAIDQQRDNRDPRATGEGRAAAREAIGHLLICLQDAAMRIDYELAECMDLGYHAWKGKA